MRSLPVLPLAAIAFISLPSLLPESEKEMRQSVAMVECRQYYEITDGRKTLAVASDIAADTTLYRPSAKKDSDTERLAATSGCWINKYPLMPSCHGRLLISQPFEGDDKLLAYANSNIQELIARTITSLEKEKECYRKRRSELDYYLNTHSVKDEGYNSIAAYANSEKEKRNKLDSTISLLQELSANTGRLKIIRHTTYTLLAAHGKSIAKTACIPLSDESKEYGNGCIVVQTADRHTPDNASPLYRHRLLSPSMEKGDSITVAAIFGLNPKSDKSKVRQGAKTFRGVMTSPKKHDIPTLLAPDGSPLFSSRGYFIGINRKGEVAR